MLSTRYRRYACPGLQFRLFLSMPILSILFAPVIMAQGVDKVQDDDEYAAILVLDESVFKQGSDGWHGGFTADNAVHPDDGRANVGVDLRYQHDAQQFSSAFTAVDSSLWWASTHYSHVVISNDYSKLRAVAQYTHDRDVFDRAGSDVAFDDREDVGMLALALDHEFERIVLTTQLQAQWRQFERRGDTEVLQQPVTLDVQKDFRSYGLNLSLDGYFDVLDIAAWARVSKVTDMDVSVCLDEICLLADAVEETFTLYEANYQQAWYFDAGRDGVSLVTELAGFASSIDHLPSNYRFSLGGVYSVRGYDEGVAGGDEAAWLRNELRWPWRNATLGLDASAQQLAYLLYDVGTAKQNAVEIQLDGQPFTLLEEDSTQLRAAGLGLALFFQRELSLRLEYAVVLADLEGDADRGDSRLHASLDWRLF